MTVHAVIPAYNAAWCIEQAIVGLRKAGFAAADIIVADDGSTDRTPDIVRALGVRHVRLETNAGAAGARNAGAAVSDAEVLLFVDADVVVHTDVRDRVSAAFAAAPGLDAMFGTYDSQPHCRAVVGRFRNMLHHFVHTHGPARPHSFWTGCGAVRRSTFLRLGGFDARLPMMEDVEFGMRLTSQGGVVVLDREMRAQHLKCWSLGSMIRMDVLDRAIPWSRLILFRKGPSNELNLDTGHRASALAVVLIVAGLALAVFDMRWLALAVAAFVGFLALNHKFHALLFRADGWRTGVAAIPLHIIHTLCAITGFGWVVLTEYLPVRFFNRPLPEQARYFADPPCPQSAGRQP